MPGHPARCHRGSWGLPELHKASGKKQKCFWRVWLLGSSGRVWFTGWSRGGGYLQLASGGVLICNTDLPWPQVGAAQLLFCSCRQLRNHRIHRPACDGGAIEHPSCTTACGCSHPLSSQSIQRLHCSQPRSLQTSNAPV